MFKCSIPELTLTLHVCKCLSLDTLMKQTRVFLIKCTCIYFHSCNQCYNTVKMAEVDTIESLYFCIVLLES